MKDETKVLMALIVVLGIAVLGLTAGGLVAAFRGDPLSPEAVTLVAAVTGGLVGAVAGAMVPPSRRGNKDTAEAPTTVAPSEEDEPPPPSVADSATTAYDLDDTDETDLWVER